MVHFKESMFTCKTKLYSGALNLTVCSSYSRIKDRNFFAFILILYISFLKRRNSLVIFQEFMYVLINFIFQVYETYFKVIIVTLKILILITFLLNWVLGIRCTATFLARECNRYFTMKIPCFTSAPFLDWKTMNTSCFFSQMKICSNAINLSC